MSEVIDEARVRRILNNLRADVDRAAGRAMAAVLLEKAEADVTDADGREALANYVRAGDRETTQRAIRAGIIAATMKLEGDLFPMNLAGEIVGTLTALDRGEAIGWAVPVQSRRWVRAARRDELAIFIATETVFRRALEDLSSDEALARVTGVRRTGSKGSAPSPDTLSADLTRTTWDKAQRLYNRGVELLGTDGVANASAQGIAERLGNPVDLDFAAYRQSRLALAKDETAWLAVLKLAKVI